MISISDASMGVLIGSVLAIKHILEQPVLNAHSLAINVFVTAQPEAQHCQVTPYVLKVAGVPIASYYDKFVFLAYFIRYSENSKCS